MKYVHITFDMSFSCRRLSSPMESQQTSSDSFPSNHTQILPLLPLRSTDKLEFSRSLQFAPWIPILVEIPPPSSFNSMHNNTNLQAKTSQELFFEYEGMRYSKIKREIIEFHKVQLLYNTTIFPLGL